ncbi:MAG: TonB C-terminal domain-containing protein [Gammaproteobacteria bacterium]|nr:TonB C-terminal domain-containing protein [Gammaproteobacteria bacterium]
MMEPRFDADDDSEDGFWRRYGAQITAGLVVLVIGAGLYVFFGSMGGADAPKAPEIQQISIVQPPPPPPPPPPQVEEPPPEVQEVDVPEPEPEPVAEQPSDEAPPGDDLGLDADGVAGADGFGLKAKKGGRALIGGGDSKKWYAGVIQTELQALLADISEMHKGRYAVVVRIWIDGEGRLQQAEVMRGTGDRAVDEAVRRALAGGLRLSHAPPEDLPQPIRIRISSRS